MEWNSKGLFLRKKSDKGYEDEQIAMINNMIAFTDDNWNTVKVGIGRFKDTNAGDIWGIVAPNIKGTLIAGKDLIIENTVLDKDNQKIVKQFKVDASGAWLNNSSLFLQRDAGNKVGDDGGKILIDPRWGMAFGNTNLFSGDKTDIHPSFIDDNGRIIFDDTKYNKIPINASMFFDIKTGNAYFAGDIYAVNGYFSGTINAKNIIAGTLNGRVIKDGTVNAGSKLTGNIKSEQMTSNVVGAINENINNPTAGKIKSQLIGELTVDHIKGVVIDAINISAKKINADKLTAVNIDASSIKSGKLSSDYMDIKDGYIKNAMIESLSADKIKAGSISTDVLKATVISAVNASVGTINGDKIYFQDGYIKSAMIESLSADKLSAGTINTNMLEITSATGGKEGLKIKGSTVQWFDDAGVVRMQAGKDKQGKFNFAIFDTTGNSKLFDENGIYAGGIRDNIINDNMIANNANISGDKLNITSITKGINKDNKAIINHNRIWVEGTGKPLYEVKKSIDGKTLYKPTYEIIYYPSDTAQINPIYRKRRDSLGLEVLEPEYMPKLDGQGKPILTPLKDKNGRQVHYEDGSPVMLTEPKPLLTPGGKPVIDNGSSLNSKLETIINESQDRMTTTMSEIKQKTDQITLTVEEQKKIKDELNRVKSQIVQTASEYMLSFYEQNISQNIKNLNTYFKFNKDNLEIGKNKDGSAIKISDTSVIFVEKGFEVAGINKRMLTTENAYIKKHLRIGRYGLVANGKGLSIRKIY